MHNKSKIQNLFLLIGTIAFVLMIYKIGIGTITDNLLKIEWWIIPILCLWILVYLLNTLSGLLIINNLEDLRRIGFFQLYKITLSTFAINTATPMGLIGGEPYKIIELSPYLGSNKATSSVILFSAMHFLAHFIFWMLSITLTLVIIPLDLTWKIALSISFIICLLLFKLTLKGCKKGIINSIFKSINADLTREWKNGDSVTIDCHPEVEMQTLNDKIAFTFGALTLARDEQKEDGNIEAPVVPVLHNDRLIVNQLDAEAGETVRFTVKTEDGDLLLTDYASCGKHWMEERNRISVWLNA